MTAGLLMRVCLTPGCGREVAIDNRTHYEVTGFVTKRKGGGPNQLTFPEYSGRVLCERCFSTRRETGTTGQGKLL